MTGREEEGNRQTLEPAILMKLFRSFKYFCHVIVTKSLASRQTDPGNEFETFLGFLDLRTWGGTRDQPKKVCVGGYEQSIKPYPKIKIWGPKLVQLAEQMMTSLPDCVKQEQCLVNCRVSGKAVS